MIVSCQREMRMMEEEKEEHQEREQTKTNLRDKLQFLDILDEALIISFNSNSFIFFAALSCLPFLCFLIFFEMILQKTFLETSTVLRQSPHDYYNGWSDNDWPPLPFDSAKRITMTLSLIKLFLLYLVPYHLLELFHISAVVDMASKLYAKETLDSSLREMVNFTRLKGALITSLYVVFLSACCLLGLTWIVANYSVLARGFDFGFVAGSYYYNDDSYVFHLLFNSILLMSIFVFHGLAFLALLMKYMEWSAGWSMSLVISVLEEDSYGMDALDLSGYYSRGSSKWKGAVLMLLFFTWGTILRLPCVLGGCYTTRVGLVLTFVYASLICVGNAMKWVVCVVYYFDCKKRVLEKKFDEENGGEANGR